MPQNTDTTRGLSLHHKKDLLCWKLLIIFLAARMKFLLLVNLSMINQKDWKGDLPEAPAHPSPFKKGRIKSGFLNHVTVSWGLLSVLEMAIRGHMSKSAP